MKSSLKCLAEFGLRSPLIMLGCLVFAGTAAAQTNTLTVSPLQLTFTGALGSFFPQPLTISVVSGSVPITITPSSAAGWLGVSSTLITATATPQKVGVVINPVVLTPGNGYDGTVTLSGPGVSSVVVSVTLNVTSGSSGVAYTASPTSLSFSSTVGGPQQSAPLTIATTNATSTPVIAQAVMNSGSGWLSVSPQGGSVISGGPLRFTVFAAPGNLGVNTYTGAINVYANGASTPSLSIAVTFTLNPQATGLLAANPSPLSFNFANPFAPAQNQTLTISTTSSLVETVTVSTTPSNSWLTVGGNSVSTTVSISANFPAQVSVGVNPSGLSSISYTGQIALTGPDLGSFMVPVQVSVGSAASSPLTATPNPINFAIPTGDDSNFNQQLTVSLTQDIFSSVQFAATVSQPSGQTWLSVNPTTLQTAGVSANVVLTVTADPAGLSSGMYDTSEVILTPTGSGAPLTIPVNLSLGSLPTLTLTPSTLNFVYQTGTALPPAQTLDLTSAGASLDFSVSASSAGGWLSASAPSSSTSSTPGDPTPLTVQVSPNGLQPKMYQGTIQVASSVASNSPQTTSVNLLVTNAAVLTANPGVVTFNYQNQSAALPPQSIVNLTSSGNQIPFSASFIPNNGGSFVALSLTEGTTPQAIAVSVNQAQLATLTPNMYQGTIQIYSPDAGNTSTNIPVTLIVGNNTVLIPSQTFMTFEYEVGKALPASQTLTLTTSGTPLTYNATASSTNCGNFLSVSNSGGTTPGSVTVSINNPGTNAGTCNGTIIVTAAGAENSPIAIPVTLNVSATSLLNVSPAFVSLTTPVGTSPSSQTVALASTDATPIEFNVTSNANGGNWLLVQLTNGSTPQNLALGFQTSSLAVGTYNATVTVTPTGIAAMPIVIPIQVVVTPTASATAAPLSLSFTQLPGGSTPLPQTLRITSSTPGLSFLASASVITPTGGNWLNLATGASTTTPASLAVSVDGSNLPQADYSGLITILVPGATPSALVVPVTLHIGSTQSLTLSSNNLSFTSSVGATTPPAAQTVMVTSSGTAVNFTVSASQGLFTVNPTSGTTPQTLSIGLNATELAGLPASATPYAGTITVSSSAGTQVINVSVTVQPLPAPVVTSVLNAASDLPGSISPGEIISIFGTNIGPSTPQGLTLTSAGTVATTLGNTTVTVNDVEAPLIYVSSGQINAIVPYEISGQATANLVVNSNGTPSATLPLGVAATAPAIFSLSQGGNGQGAILNHDFSVNGSGNPAAKGSTVLIYATGEGVLSPQPATGSVTSSSGPTYPVPVATPITVTIGGMTAQILYAGESPGLVSGVLQVNVKIPPNVGSGSQPVVLTVGSASSSAQNITVAVQ